MTFQRFLNRLDKETWHNPVLFLAVWSPVLTILILSFDPVLTAELGAFERIAFWFLHVSLLLPLLMFFQDVISEALAARNLNTFILVGLTSLATAIACAPIALALDWLFSPVNDIAAENFQIGLVIAEEIIALVVPIFCVWSLINITRLSMLSVAVIEDVPEEDPSDTAELSDIERAFWTKVPRSLGFDIISLSAEQHYLHVQTTVGHSLILFPIGKAIEAVARVDGMRIHRSHWVALKHVQGLKKDGAKMGCILPGGNLLPVSRNNQHDVSARFEARHLQKAAHSLDET
ncbi:LytTR family DNA-binding domain-containing protein [Yoonia sp. SS1-5]|uniref:LytTR family DNA-binding domain-containing protein n=1 Tax=Yoonia rhodophyticola TaxID=3137370 RepID=A0AAN0NJP9_9RHOB